MDNSEVLKIGQIFVNNEDQVLESCLGNKRTVPAGSKIIIGADGMAHFIKSGMVQKLGDDLKVKGYDTEGITEYLWMWLNTQFPLEDALQGYEVSKKAFTGEIEDALDELGLC